MARVLWAGLVIWLTAGDVSRAAEPARFIQALRRGKSVTIVTLGTSLTGGVWPWPVVFKTWLDTEWPGQVALHNLGVGASASATTPAMQGNDAIWKRCGLDRLPEAVALHPDVVFIEFAINDAYRPYGITPEASRHNLNTMIDTLLAANPLTEIVLQTMNCVTDTGRGRAETERPELTVYYEAYRETARARGLLLIDNYPHWLTLLKTDRARFLELVPDGIHPQLRGYRDIVLPELKRRLQGDAGASP